MESSMELNGEASPPLLPVTDGPASWTTSQGDDGEGGIGTLDDDADMQDSDPDTTDNYDPELGDGQDLDDEEDDLETKMDELYHQLQTETKAKESAESLLEVYRSKDVGNTGNNKLMNQVEQELQATIERLAEINTQLDYYKQRAFDPPSFGYMPEHELKESQQSFPVVTGRSHSNSFSTSDYADNEDDRQSIHSALGDIISSLRSLLDSPSVRLDHLINLVNILKQNQHIYPGYPLQELVGCLRFCLASTVREIRLNAYRCLRLLSGSGPLGPILTAHKVDIFIVRSLMADHRLESERIEALKLVRCFVTTKEGMQHVSDSILRAVISIAEQMDEKLRNACLETLGEMVMSDPKPVARCGGFRAILMALTDNLQDLSDALLKVFLYMLESPETRGYVRQGLDSEMVMAVFTDIYSLGPSYLDRVKASSRIVTSMIRSWAGLLDLCANDRRAIRSLVQSINLPIQENRKVLLDMLYDIFRIQSPKWLKDFLDGKSIKPTQEDLESYWGSNLQPLGLVDHHQSVVLTIFIDAGLIETLISLIVDNTLAKTTNMDSRKVLRKATLLVPELMQLAYKVLPPHKSTYLQTLPSLFEVACNFEDQVLRHVATNAFRFIDTLCRTTFSSIPESLDDGREQRNVDRIKQRINTQMDEANFRTLLNDTQVLGTKDVSKWQWEKILEIIQGPMTSPRRLDEAIRGTKFTKRLLAFYRPLNHRYSSQPAHDFNHRYTKLGCALFDTLANTTEGAKYLAQNKILRLIADGLAQLDPMQGHPESDPIFSKEKMETTMTSGYFEMLGTLCRTRSGCKLLEKFKIFNLYYRLSELRSRDDISRKIITSMDYSMDGHPRVILSKIMTSGYKHIRLFATQHLGTVLKNDRGDSSDWGIRLLYTQLCDPSPDVSHMAVRALDDACSHHKNLDLLIRLRPNLDHLGEAGSPLLLRFLSTSKGFQHLHNISYIEVEMDDWFMFANRQYMIQTEVKLAKAMELHRYNAFAEDGKFEHEVELQLAQAKHVLGSHFYGELTKTEEGCQLLRAKGHFSDYARYIREHCAESKDPHIIGELKSILWAVGNIGSTPGGLPFLEDEDLIKYIVGMAERSKVLSIKGTCFYVLGLLCKTTQGVEILEDYGWQGILHLDRTPRGLCLPKDLDRFLEIPRWASFKLDMPKLVLPLSTEGNVVEKEILRATGELGNHILTNGASKNLAKIKAEHPNTFTSLALYTSVLDMLAHFHFRLPVRRFILGLFDIKFEGTQWDRLDGFDVPTESKAKATTPSGSSSTTFTFGKRSASTSAVSGTTTPYGIPAAAVNRRVMTTPLLSYRNTEGGFSQIFQRSDDSPNGLQSSPPPANDNGLFRGTLAERKLRQPPLPISTTALLSSPGRSGAYQSGVTSPISVDSPIAQEQRDVSAFLSSPSRQGPDTPEPAQETDHTMASLSKALLRLDTSISGSTYHLDLQELSPELSLLPVPDDSPQTPSEISVPQGAFDTYANGGPLSAGLEQPSPIVALGSPAVHTPSLPPPPPPRPPPHAYEILYTNKPYHKNFAKEAGLAPLPPRVKTIFAAEDDDKEDRKRWPALGGSLQENLVPQTSTPPPTNGRHGATKVVVGFNPPPPPPKALPNFASFMSSRPRRQYNAAILAAHSANTNSNTGSPPTTTSGTNNPPGFTTSAATTGPHAPLPDFSHLPQTRRKRPTLAPLMAGRIQAPVASRSRSSTLTGILEGITDETPAAEDGFKKADPPTHHVALGSPLMQDGAEWSSNGSPAHRTPSSPLFVVKDHQQALSRSRAGSMTEHGYGSYGSTTSSRYHGMGSPDLRQENGSKSPGFLPPPPPLIPITVGGGGVPKPRRLSDVQAASRIGGIAPPSTTGTPPTAKSETNLPRTGSGGSTQSSPRLAGGVPFPRPPPVLAHAESASFQRMSPMASVPPPPPLLPPSQVIAPTPPLPPPPALRTTTSSDAREVDSQSGSSPSTGSTPIKKLAAIGLGLS
ncbi:MAG: Rapamycin-insensitive companion of mTOR, N-term-domain-containing protein [Linnemannia gamsii]|nr:MAG: Rapamycin-insensitive companion of mTOR, N-term-domain-containing protein [Linnemannia gamsii]